MNNKEKFKSFIQTKPELITYVKSGQMTWQKFYEIYDLYGEKSDVWSEYQNKEESESKNNVLNNIMKNMDVNSIKEHISTAQKALDFVQELTSKTTNSLEQTVPVSPRPLNKFFED